jgi:DNA-binding transcriptional LysR family regulator
VKLSGIDLNLLVALGALLEERSVTRAGKRLGLSQPTMSHALARLRALFDDPLFVRTGHRLALTPRAEALAGPVAAVLADLERALSAGASFDACSSTMTFRLAATDYSETVLLPGLLERLSTRAPGVAVAVRSLGELPSAGLESGRIDGVVGPAFMDLPEGLYRQPLFDDDFVCIARRRHPFIDGALPMDAFIRAGHVVITLRPGTRGALDELLAARGVRRTVALRVPHFLIAPLAVAHSDLIATVARRVAEAMAVPLGLQVLPHPCPPPPFGVVQVWHERTHRSPAHRWFRSLLTEVAVAGVAKAAPPGPDRRGGVPGAQTSPRTDRKREGPRLA